MLSRRTLVKSLCASVPVFRLDQLLAQTGLGVQFVNVAQSAGLTEKTIFGAESRNKYLLETTGCGAAFVDYDDDGWLDIFWSMVRVLRLTFAKARSRSAVCIRTIAMARSLMSP